MQGQRVVAMATEDLLQEQDALREAILQEGNPLWIGTPVADDVLERFQEVHQELVRRSDARA